MCFDSENLWCRSIHRTQQAVLGCNAISKGTSLKDNQYHLPIKSNVDNRIHLTLVVLIQVRCPKQVNSITLHTHWKRNGRNGVTGSGDPLGIGRHYPHTSGGCGSPHGTTGGCYGGPPDDPYGDGSDSSSTSEFARQHDQCSQPAEQFEQSLTAMNNSLIDLLYSW